MRIQDVSARVVYNGRGDPAIEAEVRVQGEVGRAISPSGASRGRHEAISFAVGGPERTAKLVSRYKKRLIGADASDPAGLTSLLKEIDGTANYSKIGGASAYSVSVAAADATARVRGIPLCRVINSKCNTLPIPLGNVIGGGKHASEKSPSIQEILVAATGAHSLREAIELNMSVHAKIGSALLKSQAYPVGRGDEGAWAPGLTDDDALELTKDVADEVRDSSGREIKLGVDFAAGSLYDRAKRKYFYRASNRWLDRDGQLSYVSELQDRFGLFYIEDPMQEEDFDGFASLTSALGRTLIVGDDLYATSEKRMQEGIASKSTNGVIVKVNQVGTLGEAMAFSSAARRSGQALIASHRSGDNESSHLSHFAVGLRCSLIKCGISGGERTSKLNELLRIEESIGSRLAKVPSGA